MNVSQHAQEKAIITLLGNNWTTIKASIKVLNDASNVLAK